MRLLAEGTPALRKLAGGRYNAPMTFLRSSLVWLVGALFLFLAACGRAPGTPVAVSQPAATRSPAPRWTLTPYATPAPFPTTTPLPSPTLPRPSHPSPTPWVYTVAKGDTLLGIALRFGVSLKALQEANPGVNPQAMAVGTRLIIPVNRENPAGLPTPTPLPLEVGAPFCEPSLDGGAVCLVEVRNPGKQAVEAVAVWLTLPGGESATAEALLNLLPAGQKLVLVARFEKAPPQPRAAVRLLRALAVPQKAQTRRYPPVEVQGVVTKMTPDSRVAQVNGKVRLQKAATVRAVWVVATAYDAAGHPVGIRRWEAPLPFPAGKAVPFALTVYSVGPPIARVVVQAEAHALLPTPTP